MSYLLACSKPLLIVDACVAGQPSSRQPGDRVSRTAGIPTVLIWRRYEIST